MEGWPHNNMLKNSQGRCFTLSHCKHYRVSYILTGKAISWSLKPYIGGGLLYLWFEIHHCEDEEDFFRATWHLGQFWCSVCIFNGTSEGGTGIYARVVLQLRLQFCFMCWLKNTLLRMVCSMERWDHYGEPA